MKIHPETSAHLRETLKRKLIFPEPQVSPYMRRKLAAYWRPLPLEVPQSTTCSIWLMLGPFRPLQAAFVP